MSDLRRNESTPAGRAFWASAHETVRRVTAKGDAPNYRIAFDRSEREKQNLSERMAELRRALQERRGTLRLSGAGIGGGETEMSDVRCKHSRIRNDCRECEAEDDAYGDAVFRANAIASADAAIVKAAREWRAALADLERTNQAPAELAAWLPKGPALIAAVDALLAAEREG